MGRCLLGLGAVKKLYRGETKNHHVHVLQCSNVAKKMRTDVIYGCTDVLLLSFSVS